MLEAAKAESMQALWAVTCFRRMKKKPRLSRHALSPLSVALTAGRAERGIIERGPKVEVRSSTSRRTRGGLRSGSWPRLLQQDLQVPAKAAECLIVPAPIIAPDTSLAVHQDEPGAVQDRAPRGRRRGGEGGDGGAVGWKGLVQGARRR